VQLDDLEISDDADDYLQTQTLIDKIIEHEKPSLFVITGNIKKAGGRNTLQYYMQNALGQIRDAGIPWVWTGGKDIEGIEPHDLARAD